jgi:hypothetical protein
VAVDRLQVTGGCFLQARPPQNREGSISVAQNNPVIGPGVFESPFERFESIA